MTVSLMKSRTTNYRGESLLTYFKAKCPAAPLESVNGASASSLIHTRNSKRVLNTSHPNSTFNVDTKKPFNSKPCPFYKWIPDTSLTVDAFNYGLIKGCEGYLLSHFHSDHYYGLSSSFRGTIYCSSVTKSFIQLTFGVKLDVVSLPLNEIVSVCGVDVVAIDANHCPGSVMFLFHLTTLKRFILHTGDFRFSVDMLLPPSPLAHLISGQPFSKQGPSNVYAVYLDTTYCSPQYDFPSQHVVIAGAVKVTREQLQKDPNTVIVCGMYTIGKERFVYGLASELKLRVWLHKKQHQLVSTAALSGCPICASLMEYVVSNPQRAQLHVLPMAQINLPSLLQYRKNLGPSMDQTPFNCASNTDLPRPITAWRPTGWSHQKCTTKVDGLRQITLDSTSPLSEGISLQQCKNNIRIYGAAYSEHSSYAELKQFVTQLNPKRVQPTVFGGASKNSRSEIDSWLNRTEADVTNA